jgi:hypothetical protein
VKLSRPSRAAQNGVSTACAEPVGPERRQHRVRRAGDAVLVNPCSGHEHAADHVGLVPRRGADELVVAERGQSLEVGLEPADLRFVLE